MKIILQVLLLGIFNIPSCIATTFYIDPNPLKGSKSGDGSASHPWRTLEEVINSHQIETKNVTGTVINPKAPVKSGDTIILNSGYHGFVNIENAFNDAYIKVTAGLNQKPTLSGLRVASAKNWSFSKLTISPAFSDTVTKSAAIVTLGNEYFHHDISMGISSNITIAESYIYSFNEEPETLSKSDWLAKAKTAIVLGKCATNLEAVNNYINKVNIGVVISSSQSKVLGNIITDYSKDGIRPSAKNILIEDNVIKNNYAVDDNHPDAIQGHAANPLDLDSISMIGNIILNLDKKASLYSSPTQGIGFFDGPIHNIQVKNNVIMAFLYHGIALYDSVNGEITHNIVFTPAEITHSSKKNVAAWITFGSKDKGGNNDNIMKNNIAHNYIIKNSSNLISLGNETMAKGTGKNVFIKELKNRLQAINTKYGINHPVSNQVRVNDHFLSAEVDNPFPF